MQTAPTTHANTLVACLCAAWCRSCDTYRHVFEQLTAAFPAYRFVWIDIEDDAELLGEVEVETFPTLLVGGRAGVQFFGPLTPQFATAQRLLSHLAEPPSAQGPADVHALLLRLLEA